jgi:hypothetical protein
VPSEFRLFDLLLALPLVKGVSSINYSYQSTS